MKIEEIKNYIAEKNDTIKKTAKGTIATLLTAGMILSGAGCVKDNNNNLDDPTISQTETTQPTINVEEATAGEYAWAYLIELIKHCSFARDGEEYKLIVNELYEVADMKIDHFFMEGNPTRPSSIVEFKDKYRGETRVLEEKVYKFFCVCAPYMKKGNYVLNSVETYSVPTAVEETQAFINKYHKSILDLNFTQEEVENMTSAEAEAFVEMLATSIDLLRITGFEMPEYDFSKETETPDLEQ